MAKNQCAKCGRELGFFSSKIHVTDGIFCRECLKIAGIANLQSALNKDTALKMIDERKDLVKLFSPTKKLSSYLLVDEKNSAFKIGDGIYKYGELLSFELLEDGETVSKGGLGRAVAGGLLFGGAGAIVGGVTGKKKTKGICTSMRIKVTFRSPAPCDLAYIDFITTDTKVGGLIYTGAKMSAQECLSALQIIADMADRASESTNHGSAVSTADEILKFKNLLDAGVISQDEFNAKKKQLLGI